MYEGFYQLTSNPFRLAPDPNFCFSHSGYKSAREYLEYALDQGEGFVMVTGRPGTGKTMLVETFLGEADSRSVVAKRIAVSDYGADDLLRAVAYAYGMDAADLDKATMRHRIQQYCVQQDRSPLFCSRSLHCIYWELLVSHEKYIHICIYVQIYVYIFTYLQNTVR